MSVKRPFAHIADEVGVTENTVKNVFNDYINELERTVFSTFSKMAPSTISSEREINYGADISTLVRMIEEGRL